MTTRKVLPRTRQARADKNSGGPARSGGEEIGASFAVGMQSLVVAIAPVLESGTQSILAVDTAGKIVLANGAAEKMFGYQPGELTGQSLAILIPKGVRGRHAGYHKAYFDNMLQNRPMGIGLELEARRRDGTTFPVEIGLSGMENPSGKFAVAFITDITERRRTQDALRQSEERLRLAVDSTGLGTFDFDPATRKRVWSDVAKSHFGLTPAAEVDDTLVQRALHPDDWDRVQHAMEEALRPGSSGQYAVEFRAIGINDGKERWISALGRVQFDAKGQPTRFLGVTQDLTERKRVEEALRQREHEISTVLDDTPDVVIRLNREYRFTYVNAKTASVAGIPREAFIGKTSAELGLPQDLIDIWQSATIRAFATGRINTAEFSYPSPAGATEWEERFIPEFAPDNSVESILILGRDVTERKRLEKIAEANRAEIRALAAGLLGAQEEERRRVSRELHDQICQQLASLAFDIGGLAAQPPRQAEVRRHFRALQARVIAVSEETRHIAYELHPSVLDDLGLETSLRDLCKRFSETSRGVALEFTGISLPAPVPRAVASCLYRVAQEGLNNIARHSGARRVSVALSLRCGSILLEIVDDGAGFEAAAARGYGGLGLIGMEERTRLVQGKLSIESRPGHGTRIELQVPLPVGAL
jgi:PAS domain S-box-containing protein